MKAPVVICIDFDSYITAIAALETLAGQLPSEAERIRSAASDFKRAHATYALLESQVITPALLRRQI
jgi:hypothetical protein